MATKRYLIGLITVFVLISTPALAVEEPAFRIVLHEGAFELRDYPSRVVAEVTVSGGQDQAVNRGFQLLAGYIFGGNKRRQSITMTAPVSQEPTGSALVSSTQIIQSLHARQWIVQFTMPRAFSLQTLPDPNDSRIRLRNAPTERLAVIRFSGWVEPATVDVKAAELLSWIQRHQLTRTGPFSLSQYNPPWTPWFLRRNELMMPIGA